MNKAVITITEHNKLDAKIHVVFEGEKESVTFALCQLAVMAMNKAVEESGAEVQATTREQYVDRTEETAH